MNLTEPDLNLGIPLPELRTDLDLPVITDLHRLFLDQIPMIDTRAPVEYSQGSLPHTDNLPLLSNEEREQIGICYKGKGHDAAVQLGDQLIRGETRQSRIEKWREFADKHPTGALFCFRGGMRSRVAQQWMYEGTGIVLPRIEGGYKAMRRFLIDAIDEQSGRSCIVLGGRTGSGKTGILKTLPDHIDLEGLANHRGSAFGPTATPQPVQINFENSLAIEFLKQHQAGRNRLVYEDEGPNIGSVRTPIPLYKQFQKSPLVIMHVSDSERENNSLREYIADTHQDFVSHYGQENGFQLFSEYLFTSIDKIRRRLGGERHKKLRQQMSDAIRTHHVTGSIDGYRPVIRSLLLDYYDPMYDYQISRKKDRIIFEGNAGEVFDFLSNPDE